MMAWSICLIPERLRMSFLVISHSLNEPAKVSSRLLLRVKILRQVFYISVWKTSRIHWKSPGSEDSTEHTSLSPEWKPMLMLRPPALPIQAVAQAGHRCPTHLPSIPRTLTLTWAPNISSSTRPSASRTAPPLLVSSSSRQPRGPRAQRRLRSCHPAAG